jgi:hypothetical protein
MKIILFYAPSFWFRTFEKVLPDVPDHNVKRTEEKTVVVFYQAEAEDVEREGSVLTKLVKNIKWLGHLSLSKAPPEFTARLITAAKDRLTQTGYQVIETPFGYLNEWKMHVAGDSLAKVFKDL